MEEPMSLVTTNAPARVTAIHGDDAADHTDHGRWSERSWVWTVVEALAYAGASVDPTAALAAQRLARIRDQERRHGR
jgi:hypothetical protein